MYLGAGNTQWRGWEKEDTFHGRKKSYLKWSRSTHSHTNPIHICVMGAPWKLHFGNLNYMGHGRFSNATCVSPELLEPFQRPKNGMAEWAVRSAAMCGVRREHSITLNYNWTFRMLASQAHSRRGSDLEQPAAAEVMWAGSAQLLMKQRHRQLEDFSYWKHLFFQK